MAPFTNNQTFFFRVLRLDLRDLKLIDERFGKLNKDTFYAFVNDAYEDFQDEITTNLIALKQDEGRPYLIELEKKLSLHRTELLKEVYTHLKDFSSDINESYPDEKYKESVADNFCITAIDHLNSLILNFRNLHLSEKHGDRQITMVYFCKSVNTHKPSQSWVIHSCAKVVTRSC